MTIQRASDNPFPSVLFEEHVDPATPPSGHWRLWVDTDNTFKVIDDAGTVTSLGGSGLSDPMTTRGDIIVRDASNVTARLAIGSSGTVLSSDGTDVSWQTPSATSLSYQQNQLTGDVTMTSANTFYDGPAVTLSAGTWLLIAQTLAVTGGNGGIISYKLWDGTTVLTNTQRSVESSAQWIRSGPLFGVAVIASGTPTWKLSVASNATGYVIKAAGTTNISGNLASMMTAVRIA